MKILTSRNPRVEFALHPSKGAPLPSGACKESVVATRRGCKTYVPTDLQTEIFLGILTA